MGSDDNSLGVDMPAFGDDRNPLCDLFTTTHCTATQHANAAATTCHLPAHSIMSLLSVRLEKAPVDICCHTETYAAILSHIRFL